MRTVLTFDVEESRIIVDAYVVLGFWIVFWELLFRLLDTDIRTINGIKTVRKALEQGFLTCMESLSNA